MNGLKLSETAYQPNSNLSEHAHSTAYFCFVLQGSFIENYGKLSRRCNPSTLVFHPAEEIHSDCFYTPTRCFNLQFETEWTERTRPFSVITDTPTDFSGVFLSQLAMRIYKEFCNLDDLSPLIVEGLTLEILGEAARDFKKRLKNSPPHWLIQARELLNEQFRESLSLANLALAVGVHETHLSREFRRFYHCTIGEYVRRRRIDYACRQLSTPDVSLTEIALAAGFFDQSHFARTFKSQIGLTPNEYRKALFSR